MLTLSAFASLPPAPLWPVTRALSEKEKVAEGQHYAHQEFKAGEVTDLMEARDTWTLSRAANGEFIVEGSIRVTWKNPQIAPQENRYRLRLSPGLHVVAITELQVSGGTMSCEFGLECIRCRKNGRTANLAVSYPYDLFSENVWLLASVVRRAERTPGTETTVKLVIADEPFGLGMLPGKVRFLGTKEYSAVGQIFSADEYVLVMDHFPSVRLLLSREGIPLVVDTGMDTEMKKAQVLVRYEKLSGF